MQRILELRDGIIEGRMVRDILNVFPEIESFFKQRKYYDEYYEMCKVTLTLEKIESLNQKFLGVIIEPEIVIIES